MKLFFDSSVLLAASGSSTGASRVIVQLALRKNWRLMSSYYCHAETSRNLGNISESAEKSFGEEIEPKIVWCDNTFSSIPWCFLSQKTPGSLLF